MQTFPDAAKGPATKVPSPVRVQRGRTALYTPEERARRDATIWTPVQGILAASQFIIFLISLGLVVNYLATGTLYEAATVSVIVKTAILLTIMVTGSIWEKAVFGQYLFAPAFFWEDMVSMAVIAAHCLYVGLLILQTAGPAAEMYAALVAYALYLVNAAQFLIKFRQARQSRTTPQVSAQAPSAVGATQ